MADDPLDASNFSGSYDNDPSTSAGGGSDSGGSDDDSPTRQEQIDEAFAESDVAGSDRVDDPDPDEDFDPDANVQDGASDNQTTIGDVAEDLAENAGADQFTDIAEEAADLATSGPVDVPTGGGDNQGSQSQPEPEPEQDTSQLRGPFQGENLSPPEQAVNEISRTAKRAARNPGATAAIGRAATGAPLATQDDGASQTARDAQQAEQRLRQQLNVQAQANTQGQLSGEGVPTLEQADQQRQRRMSQQAIQATQRQSRGPTAGDRFNQAVNAGTQAIVGPPGQAEQFAGSVLSDVQTGSAEAADAVTETVIVPGADIAGDVSEFAGLGQGSFATPYGSVPEIRSPEEVSQSAGDVLRGPKEETGPTTGSEEFTETAVEAIGTGATQETIGLPSQVIQIGDLGRQGGEFTARQIEQQGAVEGSQVAGAAALGVGTAAAGRFSQQIQENPVETGGQLIGGGAAGTLFTPVRFAKAEVPTDGPATTLPRVRGPRFEAEGPTVEADISTQRAAEGIADDTPTVETELTDTGSISVDRPRLTRPDGITIRGVRLQTPIAAEAVGITTRGKTIAGSAGLKPTVGAPSLSGQIDNVDLARLGTTGTATAEPQSAFEADVFRKTATDIDPSAGERVRASESIQRQAQVTDRPDFTVDSAEEAIGQARAVPESAVDDVTQAIRETDATVFGSAAARAQVEDFRQPRDVDIVVPDKAEAKPRLEQALEGENADVSEVFDIKEESEVPGRAAGGETIKFGRTSQEPRELGGVPFNPVNEELVRKAGASAFLRGADATDTPDRVDVGPEPRSTEPGSGVREKDVLDTQQLAQELEITGQARRRFERAFDLEESTDPGSIEIGDVSIENRRLLDPFDPEVDRNALNFGGVRRTDTDTTRRTDTDADTTRRTDTDTRTDTDESPGRRAVDTDSPVSPTPDSPTTTRVATDSPGGITPTQDSPITGAPDDDSPGGGSPEDSPPGGGDVTLPSPTIPGVSPPTVGVPPITGSPPSTGSPPTGGNPPSQVSPPTEQPPDQPTPTRKRAELPELEADEKDEDPRLFGARNPELVDFLNPLSGDVIETDADLADSVDPNRQIQLR